MHVLGKKTLSTIAAAGSLVALAAASTAAGAQEAQKPMIPGSFSANVALTSEYYFRGVSQTDDKPAIQGGFDYEVGLSDPINLYAGVWASNVDFNETGTIEGANIEIDWYGGLNGTIPGTELGWDLGFVYYWYPGADSSLEYNFVEIAASLSYNFGVAEVSASLNYSPENFGDTGDAWYSKFGVSAPVMEIVTLAAYVARQNIADSTNYTEWNVSASVTLGGFDFSVAYTDTTLGDDDNAGPKALFTVAKSF